MNALTVLAVSYVIALLIIFLVSLLASGGFRVKDLLRLLAYGLALLGLVAGINYVRFGKASLWHGEHK